MKTKTYHEKWLPKPDWRHPDYRYYCADRIHSAMKEWAKSRSQPRLVLITKFADGSEYTQFFDPATVEVGYKHGNEWYYQTVDVKDKWKHEVDSELSLKNLLAAERKFHKDKNLPYVSFHHFREGIDYG